MGLDSNDRGTLEKIIDHGIQKIPELLSTFREQLTKSRFQITNPEEFCYGNIHGRIFAEFAAYYSITHGIFASISELQEFSEILEKRSREIKDAIFECG